MSANNNQTQDLNQEEQEKNFRLSHLRHYFDPLLAAQIGVHEAILIQHFIHWISINKNANRNFHDGKTWTYQTLDEISYNFDYLTKKQIEKLLNKLTKNILIKGNYNKSKFDRTVWYAFKNESEFIEEKEKEKHIPKRGNGSLQKRTPIPDRETQIDKQDKESKPKKETVAKAPLASADAHFVSKFLYEKLKDKNPKYKPPDLEKWANDIQATLKQDNRTKEDLITIINWAFAHKGDYWPIAIQSPRTLRKLFDRAWTEITHLSEKEKTTSVFEKQTKEMNIRWLEDKIATLERIGSRGNLGYNNTHAYDTILDFSTPLASPKMIDMVKGWDQFRRR